MTSEEQEAVSRARGFLWRELNRSNEADIRLIVHHERIIPRWYVSVIENLNYFCQSGLDPDRQREFKRTLERFASDHVWDLRGAKSDADDFGKGACHLEIHELLWQTLHRKWADYFYYSDKPVRAEEVRSDIYTRNGFARSKSALNHVFEYYLAADAEFLVSIVDRLWYACRLQSVLPHFRYTIDAVVRRITTFLGNKPYLVEKVTLSDDLRMPTIMSPLVASTAKFGTVALTVADDYHLIDTLVRIVDWLISVQSPEGYWVEQRSANLMKARLGKRYSTKALEFFESVLVTAQVLKFLRMFHLAGSESSISKGISWLLGRQAEDGSWDSADFLAPSRHLPLVGVSESLTDPYWVRINHNENEWWASRKPFVTISCIETLQQESVLTRKPKLLVGLMPPKVRRSSLLASSPDIWLRQFPPRDRELAARIAAQLRLYSLSDIRRLFRRGYDLLIDQDDKSLSLFIGLGTHPAQSGPHLLALFQQAVALEYPERRLLDVATLNRLERGQVEVAVFLDDFIGRGTQAVRYLEDVVNSTPSLINARVYYLALVGFADGINLIRSSLPQLYRVDSVERLTERDRAFSSSNSLFLNEAERDKARAMAVRLGLRALPNVPYYDPRSRHALGWEGSEALIGFEHNTPNNTLPIFWGTGRYRGKAWRPLLYRYQKEIPPYS